MLTGVSKELQTYLRIKYNISYDLEMYHELIFMQIISIWSIKKIKTRAYIHTYIHNNDSLNKHYNKLISPLLNGLNVVIIIHFQYEDAKS